jgi:hypothetical protein
MGRDLIYIARCLIVAVVACAAFACSKYDSRDNVVITTYGSVIKYNGTDEVTDYYLRQDDGATLFVNNLWGYERYVDGQRVKFTYEIIDDPNATRTVASGETYNIRLYYISIVPEWDPVPLSFIKQDEEHRQDSIGHDPLGGITGMFFSGDYVNMEYTYWGKGNGPYNINLVVDDENATEDEVTVYVRHNANGDAPVGSTSGFSQKESEVSFNISSLVSHGNNAITINFEWEEWGKNGSVKMKKTGVFTRDSRSNRPISGSM